MPLMEGGICCPAIGGQEAARGGSERRAAPRGQWTALTPAAGGGVTTALNAVAMLSAVFVCLLALALRFL